MSHPGRKGSTTLPNAVSYIGQYLELDPDIHRRIRHAESHLDLVAILWLHPVTQVPMSPDCIASAIQLWERSQNVKDLIAAFVAVLRDFPIPPLWRQAAQIHIEAFLARCFDGTTITVNRFMYIVGAAIYAVHCIYKQRQWKSVLTFEMLSLMCSPYSNNVATGIITMYGKFPALDPMVRRYHRARLHTRKRLRHQHLGHLQ